MSNITLSANDNFSYVIYQIRNPRRMKHRAGARSGLCIDRMGWHGWKSRGGVGYGAPEDANKTIYIFKAVLTDME